jgi:hypothetical protein
MLRVRWIPDAEVKKMLAQLLDSYSHMRLTLMCARFTDSHQFFVQKPHLCGKKSEPSQLSALRGKAGKKKACEDNGNSAMPSRNSLNR